MRNWLGLAELGPITGSPPHNGQATTSWPSDCEQSAQVVASSAVEIVASALSPLIYLKTVAIKGRPMTTTPTERRNISEKPSISGRVITYRTRICADHERARRQSPFLSSRRQFQHTQAISHPRSFEAIIAEAKRARASCPPVLGSAGVENQRRHSSTSGGKTGYQYDGAPFRPRQRV